jgi:hypothetical protein
MVTTRSKADAAAPVSAAPSSPTTPIKLESPLQTPEPPARPLKRKRNRDSHDSPVPLKLRKESPPPLEASRPQPPSWLPELVSESDPGAPRPQSSAGLDIEDVAVVEVDESEDEQDPVFGPKLFRQNLTEKDWSDTGRHKSLEYFQAFPHDQDSTLCGRHFIYLAEKWYWQRKPTVHAQLNAMLKGIRAKPDFSGLALPICEDTWTIKDFLSFMGELREKIIDSYHLFYNERLRVEKLTGHPPICEIFDAISASVHCSICVQSPGFESPAYYAHELESLLSSDRAKHKTKLLSKLRSRLLKCGHKTPITILERDEESCYTECEDCGLKQKVTLGLEVPGKYAIKIAGVRFPVEVAPANPMTMSSKPMHVDVGGVHIVVDHCTEGILIKFR